MQQKFKLLIAMGFKSATDYKVIQYKNKGDILSFKATFKTYGTRLENNIYGSLFGTYLLLGEKDKMLTY